MHDRDRHVKIIGRIFTRLKLKQLRLLVAIAEHSSILHAAEEISVSQPSATKLLKDLETDFNVQLFKRTNRGVIPTHFGAALVRHSKLILSQLAHAAQELDDLNEGLGGRVVVGTLLTASARLLPVVVRSLHMQRPNISIVVRDGTNDLLMPRLHSGDLDMVVGRLSEYRYREGLTQEVLYFEEVVVAARVGHPLAREKNVQLDQLARSEWILPPVQTTLRRQVEREFFDRGFPSLSCTVESVSFLANRALLLETDLIGVFPLHVVQREIENGELTSIGCELNITKSPVGVSYRREEGLSPAATAFLGELRIASKKFSRKI